MPLRPPLHYPVPERESIWPAFLLAEFLGDAAPGVLIGSNAGREVRRFDHADRSVHVKIFRGRGCTRQARREAKRLQWYREAGVRVPGTVAVGGRPDRVALLVLETLPGTTLDQALRWPSRRRVLRRLGVLLGKLRGAGLLHRQLYAWHVLVDPDEVALIDVAGTEQVGVGVNRQLRDFAALFATLSGAMLSSAERWRLLDEAGLRKIQRRRLWPRLRAIQFRLQCRGRMPVEPGWSEVQSGTDRLLLHESVVQAPSLQQLGLWLQPPTAVVQRERDGRRNLRWPAPPDLRGAAFWFGKSFPAPVRRKRPLAFVEWDHLRIARELRLPVPEVVAVGRRRGGRSVLWTRGVEPGYSLRDGLHADLDRLKEGMSGLACQLARLVTRLHRGGYCHRDLYLDHFLASRDAEGNLSWVWIDWGRLEQQTPLPRRRRIRDLASLEYSARTADVPARVRLRFFRHYRRAFRGMGSALLHAVIRKADRIEARETRHGRFPVARPVLGDAGN